MSNIVNLWEIEVDKFEAQRRARKALPFETDYKNNKKRENLTNKWRCCSATSLFQNQIALDFAMCGREAYWKGEFFTSTVYNFDTWSVWHLGV